MARIPRTLRTLRNRAAKKPAPQPKAVESDKPETFYAAGGESKIERVSRNFDAGTERNQFADVPIIMGFRPNEEQA